MRRQGKLRQVLLVHGEPKSQEMLAAHLKELGVRHVESMEAGRPVSLTA